MLRTHYSTSTLLDKSFELLPFTGLPQIGDTGLGSGSRCGIFPRNKGNTLDVVLLQTLMFWHRLTIFPQCNL